VSTVVDIDGSPQDVGVAAEGAVSGSGLKGYRLGSLCHWTGGLSRVDNWTERKRNLKRRTIKDYRQVLDAYLLPAPEGSEPTATGYERAPFGTTPLRDLHQTQVKAWYDALPYGRTAEKLLMITRAVFTHAQSRGWIEQDPTASVERQQVRYSGDYDFYSREEINALVRAADSEQDAAIYLTAAMTGLRRGELMALRWRDIDFTGQAIRVRANYSFGELVTPKSGKVRSVPMVPDVAQALARLGQRERFTADDDPVFAGTVGGHLDASALRRRYVAAVRAPACASFRFTRCATISGRWRSIGRRSCRSGRGWGTRTSRRRLVISTPRAGSATRFSSLAPSRRAHQRRSTSMGRRSTKLCDS
jgi:integrase